METRYISPGWATYLRVSDEDKQTPERSFAMQRQRIQEHLLTPSDLQFNQEYRDLLSGTIANRADYSENMIISPKEIGQATALDLFAEKIEYLVGHLNPR